MLISRFYNIRLLLGKHLNNLRKNDNIKGFLLKKIIFKDIICLLFIHLVEYSCFYNECCKLFYKIVSSFKKL